MQFVLERLFDARETPELRVLATSVRVLCVCERERERERDGGREGRMQLRLNASTVFHSTDLN